MFYFITMNTMLLPQHLSRCQGRCVNSSIYHGNGANHQDKTGNELEQYEKHNTSN